MTIINKEAIDKVAAFIKDNATQDANDPTRYGLTQKNYLALAEDVAGINEQSIRRQAELTELVILGGNQYLGGVVADEVKRLHSTGVTGEDLKVMGQLNITTPLGTDRISVMGRHDGRNPKTGERVVSYGGTSFNTRVSSGVTKGSEQIKATSDMLSRVYGDL